MNDGPPTARIVGAGRAGGSLAKALAEVGWIVDAVLGRADDPVDAAIGIDLVVLAVPDRSVGAVASAVAADPAGEATVAHLSGSLTLEPLGAHPHRASLHPLMTLPDPEVGAQRLRGAWFAVAANDEVAEASVHRLVRSLDGRSLVVADEHRAAYHAAATMASNHLVALFDQVERTAARSGVPLAAYLDLSAATLANVSASGPAGALTGPAARGDWDTLRSHLEALDPVDRPAYLALAGVAARLVGRQLPDGLAD